MADIPHYHINLFWFEEFHAWIADVPDLRPCWAQGATPQEAVDKVCLAIEGWIAAAREAGQPLPAPRYSPALFAMQ